MATLPTVSKSTLRKELAWRTRTWVSGITTGSGSSTTVVASGFIGYGDDFWLDQWMLLTSGSASGQWRRITAFTGSTGTFTVAPAFSASSGNTNTFEVCVFRPDLIALAGNKAIRQSYPAIWRAMTAYQEVTDDSTLNPFDFPPDGMRDVFSVVQDPSSYVITIEGRTLLSQLTEDTTYGTLDSDTTAKLEIKTDDPAWELLVQYALSFLYEAASQPMGGGDPSDRAEYGRAAAAALQEAERLRKKKGIAMKTPPVQVRHVDRTPYGEFIPTPNISGFSGLPQNIAW